MAILGISSLVYGVEDLDESARFFDDFGLPLHSRTEDCVSFLLEEGSTVVLRPLNDPWFLPSQQMGIGVRECIWGVDGQASFDALLQDLRQDHEIRLDEEGTARFVTDFGQPIGLKVWTKRPVYRAPSACNAPGRINRINETRKWLRRAVPATIQHVVWSFPDVNATWEFYRDRLGFRLSDVQLGSGLYVRAGGAPDHHNVFIADAGARHLGFDGTIRFHHANFGVEDIDEIMVGKNYMERRGWPRSSWGLGRHRISSGAFLYLKCPAGGEAEYGADVDMLDDRWMPRIWEGKFGSNIFVHDLPAFLFDAVEWNVGFCDPMARYPAADTPGESAAPSAQAAVARG